MFVKTLKISAAIGLVLLIFGAIAFFGWEALSQQNRERDLRFARLSAACDVFVAEYSQPASLSDAEIAELRARKKARDAGEPVPHSDYLDNPAEVALAESRAKTNSLMLNACQS